MLPYFIVSKHELQSGSVSAVTGREDEKLKEIGGTPPAPRPTLPDRVKVVYQQTDSLGHSALMWVLL